MKQRSSLFILAFCLPLFACMTPDRADSNSVGRGRAVAQQWCSGCHEVARDQLDQAAQGKPSWAHGPSFMEIAENPKVDRDYLRGLASEFYFPMPAFHLQRRDQEDVISYILSLKARL